MEMKNVQYTYLNNFILNNIKFKFIFLKVNCELKNQLSFSRAFFKYCCICYIYFIILIRINLSNS